MLSPNPLSLLCALLLCLPLAILFTLSTPTTPPGGSTTTAAAAAIARATPTPTSTQLRNETEQPPLDDPTTLLASQGSSINHLEAAEHILNITEPAPPGRPPPPTPPVEQPTHLDDADEEEDRLLFERAARVSPFPRPRKKIAFMFLTTTPLPFAPLWELFFSNASKNHYNIYVHADPRFNYTPPFRGVFENRVIPSKPTYRYSPTLISAARRLLANALLHDSGNHMFVLLSPSCIPLHSFRFVYRTLAKSRRSFMEILENEQGAWERWAARGEEVMAPEIKFEDFRIGSQFFALTRRHAGIVVRDRRLWGKFKLPCLERDVCYPEEHYFPTLLSMEDPRGCIPATLTHVEWNGTYDGHPKMYSKDEAGPDLITALRSARPRYGGEGTNGSDLSRRHDPFLFARKFSPDSLQPLMTMANDVIFKD